ncbi:MAG: T9SS type A sorting domain-containing protein [Bacteroidales bacterium]|nr:T9SS type A sorting domain-containing protein [Bacteroidales bacterium]
MKTLLSFLIVLFSISVSCLNAQSIAFHENFEMPSGADSMISNPTSGWALSQQLAAGGMFCDSAAVVIGDSVILTTTSFSTIGKQFVILEFDQICKVEIFDAAYIQASVDNGQTWTTISGTSYMGSGLFGPIGNRFNASSYSLWQPALNNAIPTNQWWKHEKFDISSIVANAAQVKIRFLLVDGNNSGAVGNYGWLLDNIQIQAAVDELTPPSVSLLSPYPTDSVFSLGPFPVSASISDASGISQALLIYQVNNSQPDTAVMINNSGSTYSGLIDMLVPFALGDTICYYVLAIDSSLAQNSATAPSAACQTFIIYPSQPYPGCTNPITIYPFFETFDQNFVAGNGTPSYPGTFATGWDRSPSTGSVFTWLVLAGSTPTGLTGPTLDHTTGSGNYLYTESSYGSTGNTAILMTPCLNLNVLNVPVLEFYYHVWGSSQGELHVDIWYGNSWQTDIITPISGDQGNQWIKASINLSAYRSASTRIRFRAVKGYSIYSDIAIDDVKIWEPPANDAGIVSIDQPSSPASTGLQPIKVTIGNFGSDNLTKVTVNGLVNGQSITPFVWTGNLFPGNSADSVSIGNYNFISGPSNIKIWTTQPNDSLDGFNFNDTAQTAVIACNAPLRGLFTIGGATADFPDFDQAIYAIENCGIDSAIVFLVNPGTYYEQLNIDTIPGASQTNTVTFTSVNGDSLNTILTFAPANSMDPHIIRLSGTKHVTFSNLTISSTSTSYGRLILLESNASYITIENCLLKLPNVLSSYFSAVYGTSSKSDFIRLINNDIENGYYTIYLQSSSSAAKAKGNQFIHNNIHGFRYYGLYLYYQDSFIISQNTIINDVQSSSSYPIYTYYSDGAYRIEKNKIIATGTSTIYGLRVYYGNSTTTHPGLIANNFISLTGASYYPYGLYIYNCQNLNIYHNSLIVETDSAPTGRALYLSSGSNIRLKNNIFYNNSLGYTYYVSTPTAIVESDYNGLYTNGLKFAYWSGDKTNFAAYKTSSGKDLHSLNIAPAFVSSQDLHLTYSLLSGAGVAIPTIPDDIDGDLRSPSNPAIGADEQPPIPIDAGVLSVISPSLSEAEAAVVTPKILVKNFGTDTLQNFGVAMWMNGTPLDSQIYSIVLPPFAIDTIVFDTIIIPPGHNEICFKSNLNTDTNIFNNQLCRQFYGVPMVDMGVVSMVAPDSGQCYTNSETVTVVIKNYGSLPINMSQLPVTIHCNITGPIPVNIPNVIVNTGLLQPGASTQIVLTNNLDMNHTGDYTFKIWTSVASDGDQTNDSMQAKTVHVFATVASYPYEQNFEGFTVSQSSLDPGELKEGWAQNTPTVDYVWYVGKGSTYTSGTGPVADHSLGNSNGKYCYAEAKGYYAGSANLVTPCIDLSGMNNPVLRYWYHMFGSNIHSLRVDVFSNGQWFYSIGHKIGPQHNSSNDSWNQDFVDLSAYSGQVIKLRFRAIKMIGYEADIAIDDVSIFDPVQKDASVSPKFEKPVDIFASEGTLVPIQIKLENMGFDTIKNMTVGYIAGPNSPVLENWVGVLPPYSSQLYEFNNKYNALAGEVKIRAFTKLTGDMNMSNDTVETSFTGITMFTVPYEDDFEGKNYFYSTGGSNQWIHGHPNKTQFNSAHSGQNAWITNLSSNYLSTNGDYVYSPFFYISTMANTKLYLWHRVETDQYNDGGLIEISEDGGYTYTILGYVNDPASTNWYNKDIGGTPAWCQADSGWKLSTYDLSYLGTNVIVQFRFRFFSNSTDNDYEGWMFDDFAIMPDPIPFDAGVTKIINPSNYTFAGSSVQVTVELKNNGTSPITQIPVNYRVNGGTIVTQNWMGTLMPGSASTFTFTSPFVAPATYTLEAWTSLSNDTYLFNDSAKVDMSWDAGIFGIVSPGNTEAIGDSVPVVVQFKNYGSDTITDCQISYDIDGGTPIIENWIGVLAPDGIALHTFSVPYVAKYGVVTFCARTTLTDDTYSQNDKKCQYVSGVVGIENQQSPALTLIQNWPNPFSEKSWISLASEYSGIATYQITDLTGRIIQEGDVKLNAGENKLEVDGTTLSSGSYFYVIKMNHQTLSVKMIVLR